MDVRFLGWAGLEVRSGGQAIVVDLLADPAAIPYLREAARGETVAPSAPVDAALVTHLHRDHADADGLAAVLPGGGAVLAPEAPTGEGLETLAVVEAERALAGGPFALERLRPWESREVGPFTVTAVPAVDGTGDPQVSWVIEADGARILHGGDTMWHGWWWAIAGRLGRIDCAFLPANGVLVDFPHRQPPTEVPAVMTPEQAVEAARALRAARLVPIHHDTYALDGMYEPRDDVREAVTAAAARRDVRVTLLDAGEETQVSAPAAV